jgi:hypothetical protein
MYLTRQVTEVQALGLVWGAAKCGDFFEGPTSFAGWAALLSRPAAASRNCAGALSSQ